jgi:putative toxin-antitoxin system antitoxin component (TIGR02293 family)
MLNRAEQRVLAKFGLKPSSGHSLIDIVRAGIPKTNATAFLQWASSGASIDTMIRVAGISKRNLASRRTATLRPDQSDRLARIARIIDFAEECIGTRAQALIWLNARNQALHGGRPIDVLDTDPGAQRVKTVLGRLREGSFA